MAWTYQMEIFQNKQTTFGGTLLFRNFCSICNKFPFIFCCFLLPSHTVDCIYPWTHSHKTCFHMTSNVCVSGVNLWSFPTLMWSSLDSCSLSSQSKCAPNLRKSLHWHIESRKSIEDFLREVDEDLLNMTVNYKATTVVGTSHLGRKTSKSHSFEVIWKHVLCTSAFTGRCNWR